MIYNNRHSAKQVIRFNKWSNTSYAVFNSIGKVILIGKLSKIISGLVTVKSIAGKRLANLIEVLNTEIEKLTEFIEQIAVDELLMLEVSSIHDATSTHKSLDVTSTENSIVLTQLTYAKASKGLFSFVELGQTWLIRHFFYTDQNFNSDLA